MKETRNKNLIFCKACGAEIAKTAKTCPSCGARNKKKPLALIFIIIAIIIALVAAYIVMNLDTDKVTLTVGDTEYSWNEYRDLYHDYYLNSKTIEFKEKFTPAAVEVSGEIAKISDAIIGETMKGNYTTRSTMKKYVITFDNGCTYSVKYPYYNQEDYDFSHLAVGDKVTVKGEVTKDSLFPTTRIEEYLDEQLNIEGTLEGITKEQ